MDIRSLASFFIKFKPDTPTPPFYRDGNFCPILSLFHHAKKDSGMYKWGFFSASTVENEAPGRRIPDTKTARSGLDRLTKLNRWFDLPSRRRGLPINPEGRSGRLSFDKRTKNERHFTLWAFKVQRRPFVGSSLRSEEGRGEWCAISTSDNCHHNSSHGVVKTSLLSTEGVLTQT